AEPRTSRPSIPTRPSRPAPGRRSRRSPARCTTDWSVRSPWSARARARQTRRSRGEHSTPARPRRPHEDHPICIERYVGLVAGSLVLLSLVLAQLVSPWFLLVTAYGRLFLAVPGSAGPVSASRPRARTP